MYETEEGLLDTLLIKVTYAVDTPGPNFAVFVIEDRTDGEKVIIYRHDLVKLAALLNNELAKRAKLSGVSGDNCRDCSENNSGVTL